MNKIKTKADALTLATKFVAEDPNFNRHFCPGFNAEKPSFCVFESFDPENPFSENNEARIMIFIKTDKEHWDFYRPHLVYFYDDCTGGEQAKWMSLNEIADQFWVNHKYINKYQAQHLANL